MAVSAKQVEVGINYLIDSDTVSVQRRRVGEGRIKLCQAPAKFASICNRISIQIRKNAQTLGLSFLPRWRIRDGCLLRRGQSQPQSLIREEEESFLLPERPAEEAAKIILAFRRFRQMIQIRK